MGLIIIKSCRRQDHEQHNFYCLALCHICQHVKLPHGTNFVRKLANNGHTRDKITADFLRDGGFIYRECIYSFLADFSVITKEIRRDMLTCKVCVSATREGKIPR